MQPFLFTWKTLCDVASLFSDARDVEVGEEIKGNTS